MAAKKIRRFKRNLLALERNTQNTFSYYGISPLSAIDAEEQLGGQASARSHSKYVKRDRAHTKESLFISR